eukprot:scaffold46115_cov66-Phaeocystis_antarctica.AAC.8
MGSSATNAEGPSFLSCCSSCTLASAACTGSGTHTPSHARHHTRTYTDAQAVGSGEAHGELLLHAVHLLKAIEERLLLVREGLVRQGGGGRDHLIAPRTLEVGDERFLLCAPRQHGEPLLLRLAELPCPSAKLTAFLLGLHIPEVEGHRGSNGTWGQGESKRVQGPGVRTADEWLWMREGHAASTRAVTGGLNAYGNSHVN